MDKSDIIRHEQMIRCVAGTMSLEGVELSDESIRNIERYANRTADAAQLIEEWKRRYNHNDLRRCISSE